MLRPPTVAASRVSPDAGVRSDPANPTRDDRIGIAVGSTYGSGGSIGPRPPSPRLESKVRQCGVAREPGIEAFGLGTRAVQLLCRNPLKQELQTVVGVALARAITDRVDHESKTAGVRRDRPD